MLRIRVISTRHKGGVVKGGGALFLCWKLLGAGRQYQD